MNAMTPITAPNGFRQWWDQGYHDLIPVVPAGAKCVPSSHVSKGVGKSPGSRYSSGLWGGFKGWNEHKTTETDLDTWHGWGASIGLRIGDAWMLDLDVYDRDTAEMIEAKAIEMLGPAPQRVGMWPKRSLLYRSAGDIKPKKMQFAGKSGEVNNIEIPFQSVVQGVHPKTQKPYSWPRAPKALADLTVVSLDQVLAFMRAMKAMLPGASDVSGAGEAVVDQDGLRGHPDVIADIMHRLPNVATMRWDYMVRLGYALNAALPDDLELAFELWDDWCMRWEGDGVYDPDVQRVRWDSFKGPYRAGAKWLYEEGERLLGVEEQFEARAILWDGKTLDEMRNAPEPEPDILLPVAEKKPEKTYNLERFDDIASQLIVGAPALIDGLLDQGAMSVTYGDSNAGKTFVVMDMAYHIATGRPYAGMDVQQGLVVYIAAEGGMGAKKRIVALKQRYPTITPEFLLLASPVDLRRPDADLVPLTKALKAINLPIAFLVVDTLSRAMAGGDENGSVDMGAVVQNADLLRKAISPVHLMFIHHTGKDRAKGARGHSLLRAATDTEIEVEAIEGASPAAGTIKVTKQRDMDGSWSQGFKLRVHTIGIKDNGKPVTSCTVDLVGFDEAKAAGAKLTAKEREVLTALEGLQAEREGAVSVGEVAARLMDNPSKSDVSTTRSHLRNLEVKGYTVKIEGGKWLKKVVEDASTTLPFDNLSETKVVESGRKVVDTLFD